MKQLLRLVAFAFGLAIASSVSYGQQAPNNPTTAATQPCSDNSNRIANTKYINNCVGVLGSVVTSIATGTGLTGGPITTAGTIALANIAGVAGTYTTPNLTVNGQGQITTIASGNVPGFPFVLGSTTITAGATVTTVTGLTLAGPTITGFLGGAPNFSGVPIFSGLSAGTCASNVYLDAGQHLVTGGCPIAGPGSSVANHVVTFADASGHLAIDSGILASAVVQTTRAISTSPPLSGGGSLSGDLTLSLTGPSNLTTFTSNVIPKGAGASAFAASSLTDNGTTVSTAEQIVSTLANGTPPFVVASSTLVANLNASQLGGATFAAPGAIGGTTPAAGSFSSLLDSAMAGTGVRCVQVDNTGLMSVAAGGCASSTGVTSVATTSPILGGTITTTGTISLTGPSNLTTFTTNVIPKGAGTASFASSSLTDNGTTITTAEQIVSTLTTGTAPFVVASTTNVANLNATSLNLATFAAPGPIGSTTASTGAFTTLSATSTVNGAGITALFASPPAIGGTAAGSGAFTTLSATSTVNGAGITALFASPPAIGGTVAAAGSFSSLLDTGMAGAGVKCVHVDNTGALSVAAGDCAAGGSGSVTSIATTAPVSGGTITTTGTISLTGPSNLTTFTTSAIPKGAGASAFVASSLVDNGTTVTTGEQIVSTLASGGVAPLVVASTTNVANLNASSLAGATFASPGPIGSTAASTGAFTTLSASTSITDTALAGSGVRCVRVDNTGLMGIAAGDCGVAGGTVQSIATTAPITGGTITVTGTIGITGPSNLTTFTANAIPKGATASPFVASSLVDNGTTVSTAEQIVSTLAQGTAPFSVASTTNVANLNASFLGGTTFAAPGPIGSGTASTGAFTTLSASSTVSGAGVTALFASPPAIGGTAAAAGSFTTVSASGQITSTLASGGVAPLVITSTTNVANLNASSLNGATFAAPGPIGSTTPSTGAFTTLSASSTVSGAGFSTYLASPPAIGGTVAAAGSFTTLSASSTVSGAGFSTYLASPPAIGSTAAGTGAFTTLSANSTVTLSGLAAGSCTSGISIDASNHIVKIACPGGGGTVTSVGLGPGLTATIGSQNVTPITTAGTINLQLWPTPKSSGSPYTLVPADTGNLIQANAGTFAFKFPNPNALTKGTIYQLSDILGNGFTATTVGGTALLYGSPNTGAGVAVTATLGVNEALTCVDDGTNYACAENPGLASASIFGIVKPDNFSIYTTAGVLSAHDTVATGLTAAGTTQATALQLTSTFNVVTSVAVGTGVALMSCAPGVSQYVRNSGANDLLVYTKNGDSAVINNQVTTAGQIVPQNTTAFYKGTATTQCYSIP